MAIPTSRARKAATVSIERALCTGCGQCVAVCPTAALSEVNNVAKLWSLLTDPDITLQTDCPIAAITWDGCNGPYPVSEDIDIARYYLTVEYSTVGIIQNQ